MIRSALADRIIISLNTYRRGLYSTILFLALSFAFLRGDSVSYFLLFPLVAANQAKLSDFSSGKAVTQNAEDSGKPEQRIEDKENSKGMDVAIYMRVSTDRQAEKGFSLQDQERRLNEEAKRMGASRIYPISDPGESGTDFTRKGLNEILELAKQGKIRFVLVTSLDRIGRDLVESLDYVRKLRVLGVKIKAAGAETDISTEEGLMISVVQFLSAELENKRRARSSDAGRVQSFRTKHWSKPRPPAGYRKSESGWIEKNPGWGPLVKRMYELYLRRRNYVAVCSAVNAEFKTFLRKPLTHQQIGQMLRDPVYVGRPQYAGKVVVGDPSLAYVDSEIFRRVQEISERSRRERSHKKEDVLKGMMKEFGPEVLESIPDIAVLCPSCKGIMVRNGTFAARGLTCHNYLCKGCGKQRRVPTKRQVRRIQANFGGEKGLNTKEVNRELGI